MQRIHDHFAANFIRLGSLSLDGLKRLRELVSQARSGNRFAQDAVRRKSREKNARLKEYFSEVRRVLRPGGKLVLVNEAGKVKDYETPIRTAGLKIRRSSVLDEAQAEKLGFEGSLKWIKPEQGEKLHLIIAAKAGLRSRA